MPAARLASAGPGLFIVYGICGIFVFLILRALGELVLHRPSSGSFVSYAREFFGEKVAFAAGWMYFLNWAMTGIVDTTAIAHYCHYWKAFHVIPQWTLALIALVVVVSMNLISVKVFGELEFWASLVKVLALVTFLVVGTVFLAGRFKVDGQDTGPGLWSSHGGLLPSGLLPLVLVTSGVVFAYAAIELVGIAAGETENPEKIMPRAINSVVFRIAVFYVGSTILLGLLLPYTAYHADVEPVRDVLLQGRLPRCGQPDEPRGAHRRAVQPERRAVLHGPDPAVDGDQRQRPEVHRADVEERRAVRRDPAHRRDRPVRHRAQRVRTPARPSRSCCTSRRWVSWWPGATIVACQLRFYQLAKAGQLERPKFRMPFAPYSGYATLVFLVAVLVLMFFDKVQGPWMLGAAVIGIPALIGGWYLVRDRVRTTAAEGSTGA